MLLEGVGEEVERIEVIGGDSKERNRYEIWLVGGKKKEECVVKGVEGKWFGENREG